MHYDSTQQFEAYVAAHFPAAHRVETAQGAAPGYWTATDNADGSLDLTAWDRAGLANPEPAPTLVEAWAAYPDDVHDSTGRYLRATRPDTVQGRDWEVVLRGGHYRIELWRPAAGAVVTVAEVQAWVDAQAPSPLDALTDELQEDLDPLELQRKAVVRRLRARVAACMVFAGFGLSAEAPMGSEGQRLAIMAEGKAFFVEHGAAINAFRDSGASDFTSAVLADQRSWLRATLPGGGTVLDEFLAVLPPVTP